MDCERSDGVLCSAGWVNFTNASGTMLVLWSRRQIVWRPCHEDMAVAMNRWHEFWQKARLILKDRSFSSRELQWKQWKVRRCSSAALKYIHLYIFSRLFDKIFFALHCTSLWFSPTQLVCAGQCMGFIPMNFISLLYFEQCRLPFTW